MLKKTITYTDYDGNERTEDFWFNLSQAEVMKMDLGVAGGMEKRIRRMVEEQNGEQIISLFEDIVFRAYGQKSPDGKRFVKSKELSEAFSQTEAYNNLFMELLTDSKKAADFINGVLPKLPENLKAVPADAAKPEALPAE